MAMRHKLRAIAALWASVAVAGGMLVASHGTAMAYPIRTHVPFAIILCQMSDSAAPMHDPQYYADMYVNRGTGGVADYFNDVSYGNIDLAGSVVMGWYTENQTVAQAQARDQKDRHLDVLDCLNKAKADSANPFTVPSGYLTVVITNPALNEFGGWGTSALLQEGSDVSDAAHEMLHNMGAQHSFSDDPGSKYQTWSQVGE